MSDVGALQGTSSAFKRRTGCRVSKQAPEDVRDTSKVFILLLKRCVAACPSQAKPSHRQALVHIPYLCTSLCSRLSCCIRPTTRPSAASHRSCGRVRCTPAPLPTYAISSTNAAHDDSRRSMAYRLLTGPSAPRSRLNPCDHITPTRSRAEYEVAGEVYPQAFSFRLPTLADLHMAGFEAFCQIFKGCIDVVLPGSGVELDMMKADQLAYDLAEAVRTGFFRGQGVDRASADEAEKKLRKHMAAQSRYFYKLRHNQ
ncbi:hypothetical protein HaLaN_10289 [Haematococcus lacustris]|uniref:Uncharacterized protein n=1 Tax=Haematococcus lacustris TaxID=44745 RepID=A0A699Z4Q9_HAELA|nr:hypothetical protein HaLaN_10289 [Haematococcus lacustris]